MRKIFVLLACFCWLHPILHSQTISGIINTYTSVTEIISTTITVTSATGFSVGDKILIIQMKGAEVSIEEDETFGDILNYHSAGFYEFAYILAIDGLEFEVEIPLCHTYDPAGKVQVIRVPVYMDVTISGEVTAPSWDGETGGVVVLDVLNTLTLNASINVDGMGFRGGERCNGFFTCGMDDYGANFESAALLDCDAGQKGESIAFLEESINGGRGKVANGGGGSGTGQHGGSGGGNFGAGGRSAFEWTGCFVYDEIWAPGASALDYSIDRVFLGGGGGGGQQDNGLSVTDGANGGGIVIINANTIEGLDFMISANGNDVSVETDSEGAGGAGAGGSVILRVSDFPSSLMIEVDGGDGGDIESTLWAGTCHGPGGAGGGGYVGFSAPSLPATVTVSALGGEAGIIISAGAFCDGTPHGAENGADGGMIFNLQEIVLPFVELGPNLEFCDTDPLNLDAGGGFSQYSWSTGDTTQVIEITEAGEYIVTVVNTFGCSASDTIQIVLFAGADVTLPETISFCAGESYLLDAGPGFETYLWQNASTAQTLLVDEAGTYTVTVTNEDGCEASVSSEVTIFLLPEIELGPDIEACAGVEVLLNAFVENATYVWSTGVTTSFLITSQPGVYSVIVTSEDGCEAEDFIQILDPCGQLIFPNAFTPNSDGINDGFKPVVASPIGNLYQLEIYSRWGELLFTTSEITNGWDGKINQKDAEIDSYVWVVHYNKENSTIEIVENGWVVLVR